MGNGEEKTERVEINALQFQTTLGDDGLTAGLFAADKAVDKTAARPTVKKPTLKVDASSISDTKSAVVLSYADALEAIRPAVVSVYSSKIVRQQVPEFLRQFGAQGREQKQRGLGSGVIISNDGLLPPWIGAVHPRFNTPVVATLLCGAQPGRVHGDAAQHDVVGIGIPLVLRPAVLGRVIGGVGRLVADELAHDEAFTKIAARGIETAVADEAHSVHAMPTE